MSIYTLLQIRRKVERTGDSVELITCCSNYGVKNLRILNLCTDIRNYELMSRYFDSSKKLQV